MPNDVFGDLREWGVVLNKLEELKAAEVLDEHQTGLARLVRCADNWRVQQEALIAALRVKRPRESLIREVLKVLTDSEASLENRIWAARAAGSLLNCARSAGERTADWAALETMLRDALADGGPPILQRAIREACERAGLLSGSPH